MANKDKLLESAQKNLKKKQLPRAIKDFVKVVEIDPGDMRSRQKLAELYVRVGKSAEAFEQYEAVAKYFASNGFYLKAIAIYKQMQRLDSTQVTIFNRLAELNEKQGLIGNAMAEYRHLVGYYEKNGMVADAIKTLEKMRDLDQANVNVQVKLAEVYANNDRIEEGLQEFERILAHLSEKNDFDKILKLYKMFLPLFPHDPKLQKGLALTLYEKGELEKGITILQNLMRENADEPEVLRLLAKGYEDLQDHENTRLTYLHLLKLDSADLEIREALVKCCLDAEQYDEALQELEEWKETFLKANRLEQLKLFYETLNERLANNQQVLQTLDSIYELTGEGDKLLEIMSESEQGSAFQISEEETLSDSLLDTAVEDMEEQPFLQTAGPDEELIDLGDEEVPLEESSFDLELEPLEEVVDEEEPEEEIIELNLSEGPPVEEVIDESLDLDFDLGDEEVAAGEPARDIQADLEEAEFYLQQGLFDEAERVCREILEYRPDSAECRQKLDEIAQRRGSEGAESEASAELHDLAAEVLEEGFPDLDAESLLAEESSVFAAVDDEDQQGDAESRVFRTDVDEQIAADDMESHYNLGIAYREMGLFDDAISEFEKAEKDPARYVDCQTLKGLCLADKGDFERAEVAFKSALAADNLDDGQRLSLYYEMGLLYENWERPLDALDSYQFVADADLFFRDVADKTDALRKELGLGEESAIEPEEEKKDRISFL